METQLLELSKQTMATAQTQEDFTIEDYSIFSDIVQKIEEINEIGLKPHLVIWNMNVWGVYSDHIISALELLGYEYVGNMDLNDNRYKFTTDDIVYDRLFKFKAIECDYTRTLKVKLD